MRSWMNRISKNVCSILFVNGGRTWKRRRIRPLGVRLYKSWPPPPLDCSSSRPPPWSARCMSLWPTSERKENLKRPLLQPCSLFTFAQLIRNTKPPSTDRRGQYDNNNNQRLTGESSATVRGRVFWLFRHLVVSQRLYWQTQQPKWLPSD